MSLANIIVQQPKAYLMADSGWFNRDGTIACLKPKTLEFHKLSMALTCRGQHDMLAGILREMHHFEAQHGSVTGHDIIAGFAMLYQAACTAQGVPARGREHACDMQVIWYDGDARRSRGFIISNIVDDLAGLEPFTLQPVACSFTGSIDPDAPLGSTVDVTDPGSFDVTRDGVELVDRQRSEPWSIPGYPPAHYVAGTVYLTSVSAAGVGTKALRAYPDKVGRRVAV